LTTTDLAGLRVDYGHRGLDLPDLAATWHEQLGRWLDEAVCGGVTEPNAMVVATVDGRGWPSTRTVLCKGMDARGVVFYTNYGSAKSGDLVGHPVASATFPWVAQFRQVHVRGEVCRVDRAETETYWATRPRTSQVGAWASAQSAPVTDRAALHAAMARAHERFPAGTDVPVPPHWGGWRILPSQVEFWQGHSGRLHDRLRFETDGATWRVVRLAP
jgi:pyridoxamine 5'-phosphate oxidase